MKSLMYVKKNDIYWIKLFVSDRKTWNYLSVYKQMSIYSLKNKVINKTFRLSVICVCVRACVYSGFRFK